MESEQFCYWLQGFFELSSSPNMSPQQVQIVKNHLALVFEKVTPEVEVEDAIEEFDFDNILGVLENTIAKPARYC